jgi:SAM-dependent methyltransferase
VEDPLIRAYERFPYRHGAIAPAHPARLAAIGRLLGLPAALPERCRVLELGCAEGWNLLPLAERFPQSEFVGVDFVPGHIEAGEKARQHCGLQNAKLICGDLRTFALEPGSFDYVIAHGVYSWVNHDVGERLLALCAEALRPNGIAYVSYNTLPGCALPSAIRQILRPQLDPAAIPAAIESQVRHLLKNLTQAFANESGFYAALMREVLAEMSAKPVALLMHDELSEVNHPCTFLDFMSHAGRHRLHFLAEAHFASMPLDHLRPEAREALGRLGLDFPEAQQFLDLIGNRRHRSTLLTREEVAPGRALDSSVISDCALCTHLTLARPEIDLRPGIAIQVAGKHGVQFAINDPALKAILGVLIAAAPDRITFAEAVERAHQALSSTGVQAELNEDLLCHALAKLFTSDQLDLLFTGSTAWLQTPEPTALMRYQAEQGLPVVNRCHEIVA